MPQNAMPLVVVVDDDPALLGALAFALEIEGFAVRTYAGGPAMLCDAAGTRDAACLVIDYRLPEMNGLDLLDALRACGIVAPAILITTNPNGALRETARQRDMRIIEKPLLTNALSDAIRCAIGVAHHPPV